MNVYKYEVKAQLKSLIIWTATLILTLMLFMGGIYPIFNKSSQDMLKVMEGFPKGFMEAFGFQISRMFSYGGFYSFSYGYIALVASIMAVIVALSIFAREKKMKCFDFLLTKPMSRSRIFGMKALSYLTILIITNIIFVVVNLIIYYQNGQSSDQTGRFVLASFGILFTQLVFGAIGLFLGTYMKKIRSISGLATSIGFITFILSALANLTGEEVMNYIAPLKYFDPVAVMDAGHYEGKYIITALIVIVICTVTSYIRFCNSDVHAV
jgi:ABC-type transport system involved in multi-copper enzyme maturation permease subunit